MAMIGVSTSIQGDNEIDRKHVEDRMYKDGELIGYINGFSDGITTVDIETMTETSHPDWETAYRFLAGQAPLRYHVEDKFINHLWNKQLG
jgi:hypothetical protein